MPTCPSCGAKVRPGVRFCPACGNPIAHTPNNPTTEHPLPKNTPAKGDSVARGNLSTQGRPLWLVVLILGALALFGGYLLWGTGREVLMGQEPSASSSTLATDLGVEPPATLALSVTVTYTPRPSPTPDASRMKTAEANATPSLAPTATPTPTPAMNPALAFFSYRQEKQAIIVMDPDRPEMWREVPAPPEYELFAWPSFCGEVLAFEARDRSLNLPPWIYLYDFASELLEPLAFKEDPPTRLAQPSCSPDGHYLVMRALRDNRWHLSVFDRQTQTIVTERPMGDYMDMGYSTWSTKEGILLLMGTRPIGSFLLRARASFTNPFLNVEILTMGKYPALSPDGQRLAYFCGNLFYLCMAEWPSLELLFQIPVSYFKKVDKADVPATAAWSRDGRWLYFASSITGNWDIFRMRPDGSHMENLTETWLSDEFMPTAR